MCNNIKKGPLIPCDTCYDNCNLASVSVEACQERVRNHQASCIEFEQWLLVNEKRYSEDNRRQQTQMASLRKERDDALEKLEGIFQLCVSTVARYHEEGSDYGVPVVKLYEKLGFPPFEDTRVVPSAVSDDAGPPEPPKPCTDRPLVLCLASLRPLEGLIVHVNYPHISSSGPCSSGTLLLGPTPSGGSNESASVHLQVALPANPLVAAEVIARISYLFSNKKPLTVKLWKENPVA